MEQRTYDDLIAIKRCIAGVESLNRVLATLDPLRHDELYRRMNLEVFESGDLLFSQGDPGDKYEASCIAPAPKSHPYHAFQGFILF